MGKKSASKVSSPPGATPQLRKAISAGNADSLAASSGENLSASMSSAPSRQDIQEILSVSYPESVKHLSPEKGQTSSESQTVAVSSLETMQPKSEDLRASDASDFSG
jgi:hypothetical protein